MTVSSTLNRVSTNGNGVSTAFPVSFPFQSQSDLVVLSTVIATGVQTTKTITTHYTISGTPDALGHYSSGGSVDFLVAPASTERITIYRDPARTQSLDLQDASSFPAESVEAQLDYATMLLQRVSDQITRSLRQPDGDSANIATLPSSVDRASSFLAFDSNGNPVAASTTSGTVSVSAFMETVADDSTAENARATLQAQQTIYCPTVGGTVDAITLTPTDPWTSYENGKRISFLAAGANTGSCGVNVSGLGLTSIVSSYRNNGSAGSLQAGELSTGQHVELVYRSGSFQLVPYMFPRRLSWTPFVGGNATYTTQTGEYSRDGGVVTFTCNLTINVLGTGSAIQISGLPFSASQFTSFPVYWNGAASNIVTCVAVLGGTTLTLYSLTAAGATLTSANNILQNGTVVYISGSYITTAS